MKDNYYIIEYSDDVPYEASWTETKPVMFNGTKEELEMEFEIAVENVMYSNKSEFDFNNLKELPIRCFTYQTGRRSREMHLNYSKPNFYTFEEWCIQWRL